MRVVLATFAVAAVCLNVWTATLHSGAIGDTASTAESAARTGLPHGYPAERAAKLEHRNFAQSPFPADLAEAEDETNDQELDLSARPMLFAFSRAQSLRASDHTLISTRATDALERPPRA